MPDDPFLPDEDFQTEIRRARRLFFLLLPFTLLAIAASWVLGSGMISGAQLIASAENLISSVYGYFGGATG